MFVGCDKENPAAVKKPEVTVIVPETGTVTDIDGNVYKTVKIGNQWWMAENLKVKHYRNGEKIFNETRNSDWSKLTIGAYCNYDNDANNLATYGSFYNWYAIIDSRIIAPEGWHVPTDDEWKELEMYLGMSRTMANNIITRGTEEGGKLKETGTIHWSNPNTGATNESGFSALPGGSRRDDGSFIDLGNFAFFWSASYSFYNYDLAMLRALSCYHSAVYRNNFPKDFGFSVRCVRD